MPDLSPLPPLRPVPAFRADPDRFALARAAARRRRTRSTALPIGACAVAAAVAFAVTPPAASQGIGVTTVPTDSPVPTPWVSYTAGPGEVAVVVGVGPSPSDAPSAAPSAPPPAETASPGPEPTGTEPPGPPPAPESIHAATLDHVPFDAPETCQGGDGTGWCLRILGPFHVAYGGSGAYVVEACRPGIDGSFTFAAADEVRITLVDGSGAAVAAGDWSAQPNGTGHTVTVAGGTCARWTAPFQAVDDRGRPLPRATYAVGWEVLASGVTVTAQSDDRRNLYVE